MRFRPEIGQDHCRSPHHSGVHRCRVVLPQKWYNEIWAPFLKDSAVTIRTKGWKKSWPGVYDRIAGFKDERTGSQTFVYRIRCTFDEPGEYVIEKVFAGTDEIGKRIQKQEQWNVVVRHPPHRPSCRGSLYYFGEFPMIAFATREFPQAQGYTYSVWQMNGVRADTGSGSNIFLSKIANDPKNAASEKEWGKPGYYAGRTFNYQSERLCRPQEHVALSGFEAHT